MQRPDLGVIDAGILQRHETMYETYFEDLSLIPKGRFCELRFTDLEADPENEVTKIYNTLSPDFSSKYEVDLKAYVGSLGGYKKNNFSGLNDATKAIVAERWRRSFEHVGVRHLSALLALNNGGNRAPGSGVGLALSL